jgi:hypothetical protein
MIVVPPLVITDAMITTDAVAEPNAPANYAGGTTYALGNQVTDTNGLAYQSLQAANIGNTPSVSPLFWQPIGYKEILYNPATTYGLSSIASPVYTYSGHRVYQSIQAANTGNTPISSPLWWTDVGPTNKYGMFDLLRNTATVTASPLTVVLTPGVRIDTVGLVGIVADSVTVSVTSGGVTVYNQTQTLLITSFIGNWYQYCFAAFKQDSAALFQNIPPVTNGIVTITLSRGAGNVSLGSVVMGTAIYLGGSQTSAVDSASNYSTISRDTYGNSQLVQRRSVPQTTQTTWLPSNQVQNVRAARVLLNAAPALWAGIEANPSDFFESFLILGIYKQFDIEAMATDTAKLTLNLEEV